MTPAETPAEILKAARAKIEKPENWCQGAWAMDEQGEKLQFGEVESPAACRWCAEGAFNFACSKAETPHSWSAHRCLLDASHAMFGKGIWMVNDTHTHPEVLQMFDLAIEKAETAEAT